MGSKRVGLDLLLLTVLLAVMIFESSPVWSTTTTTTTERKASSSRKSERVMVPFGRRKNAAAVAFVAKKRDDSAASRLLCPSEYAACACEFMSPDQLNVKYDHYDDDGAGGKAKSRIGKSTLQSIVIDCQIDTRPVSRQTLREIPKLVKTGSVVMAANISKYFKHITHLDLSRTAISHVPTDAFMGLSGLETIVINHCKNLTVIRRFAFRNLPNLKTLIISNNPSLVQLEPYSFGSLFNLKFLSLAMNQLAVIDGYIFSASTSIRIIDFIGNPVKRIKSHAFHGLRNVSELLLSLKQNKSPIEVIEDDSFITTAFVDQIYLEGIPARHLATNAFRGLSHCKSLLLTHTHIEHIHAGAFMRANNIKRLSLMNSRVRNVSRDAFRGIFNVDTIDLRGNYLASVPADTFESLLVASSDRVADSGAAVAASVTTSVVFIDTARANSFVVKKILFEQNPIQCDCALVWILAHSVYRNSVSLPELCAGPKGFDCLRISEIDSAELICPNSTSQPRKIPCDHLVFDVDKNIEIYSVSAPKGKKKSKIFNANTDVEEDDVEYEEDDQSDDEFYNRNRDETTSTPSHLAKNRPKSSVEPMTRYGQGTPAGQNPNIKSPIDSNLRSESESDEAVKASTSSTATLSRACNTYRCSNSICNSVISITLLFSFRFVFVYFFGSCL